MQGFEEECIYLAGLFDGEGSFSIQVDVRATKKGIKNVRFNPRLTLTLCYGAEEALSLLQSTFGGQIYVYDKITPHTYRWNLSRIEELKRATSSLIPHLIVKREIARRFLDTLEKFPSFRRYHASHERTWTKELCIEVATIAYTLNPNGKTFKSSLEDKLKQIEAIYADDSGLSLIEEK